MNFSKPTYTWENKLWRNGLQHVAGLDEVGRGALAGPVVAVAVVLPRGLRMKGLNDSKLLSVKKREELFLLIQKSALGIGVGIISHEVVDREGIIPATRQAFIRSINKLPCKAHYLLVDGVKLFDWDTPIEFVIRGDARVGSIAAASIVAKVIRDKIMAGYHDKYPQYDFDTHKGYGTKKHRELIDEYGLSEIHRKSFIHW